MTAFRPKLSFVGSDISKASFTVPDIHSNYAWFPAACKK